MKPLTNIRRKIAQRLGSERGNAVLFSMIIITAAMVISLGMASLILGEVRSAGLVLPAERAYYKAESYVEQALWHKKQDPDFSIADVEQLNEEYPDFLCASQPCFATSPRDQADMLKEFFATTSPTQEDVPFVADTVQQYDIVTAGAGGSGSVEFSDIRGEDGFLGLEVTIVAYPVSGALPPQFPVDSPGTPVFVDKVVIPANDPNPSPINLGTGVANDLGESYPPLNSDHVYRVRVKALGANAAADVTASSGSTGLTLRSPDFSVRSVAEDSRSRRGIEVLSPASERAANIFDFTLFSDLDLNKIQAKMPAKSVVVTVYNDADRDCVQDPGETGAGNIPVTRSGGGGSSETKNTSDSGSVSFLGLSSGATYQVTVAPPGGSEVCPPASQSVSFLDDPSTQVIQRSFLVRSLAPSPVPTATPTPPRGPLYRMFSGTRSDHFYTMSWPEVQAVVPAHTYVYEGITGYMYSTQSAIPGLAPFYRAWQASSTNHFYTMNLSEMNNATQNLGYVYEGVTGYMYPYTGSCPAGSAPLYRTYWPQNPRPDHFYTMSLSERNTVVNSHGHINEGIAGCMWTTP